MYPPREPEGAVPSLNAAPKPNPFEGEGGAVKELKPGDKLVCLGYDMPPKEVTLTGGAVGGPPATWGSKPSA